MRFFICKRISDKLAAAVSDDGNYNRVVLSRPLLFNLLHTFQDFFCLPLLQNQRLMTSIILTVVINKDSDLNEPKVRKAHSSYSFLLYFTFTCTVLFIIIRPSSPKRWKLD